jgi:hypothetical protein
MIGGSKDVPYMWRPSKSPCTCVALEWENTSHTVGLSHHKGQMSARSHPTHRIMQAREELHCSTPKNYPVPVTHSSKKPKDRSVQNISILGDIIFTYYASQDLESTSKK